MLNQQIISPDIIPLRPDQTVEEALLSMEDQMLRQLPVVAAGVYEGLLSEDDLFDSNQHDVLSSLQHLYQPFSVVAEEHFLTAASTLSSRRLQLVPVVSANKEYVGAIGKDQLLQQLTQLCGAMSGGALLVLEMEPHQYSISELSKLVETNDAHITQLNSAMSEQSGHLLVTLRINKREVSDIVATLQRYEYHVVFYSGEEHYENEMRRNYDHLMNFLTM